MHWEQHRCMPTCTTQNARNVAVFSRKIPQGNFSRALYYITSGQLTDVKAHVTIVVFVTIFRVSYLAHSSFAFSMNQIIYMVTKKAKTGCDSTQERRDWKFVYGIVCLRAFNVLQKTEPMVRCFVVVMTQSTGPTAHNYCASMFLPCCALQTIYRAPL